MIEILIKVVVSQSHNTLVIRVIVGSSITGRGSSEMSAQERMFASKVNFKE